MKEGRPTKYKKEYIGKAQEYLAECTDDEFERGEDRNVMYKIRVKLPTIEGFARFLGVNKTTLYEWSKEYPEFSNALEEIKTEQQERLINNGLNGDYNPTIAKLMLSSNHGMKEKSEQDITTGGEKITPLLVRFLGDEPTNS